MHADGITLQVGGDAETAADHSARARRRLATTLCFGAGHRTRKGQITATSFGAAPRAFKQMRHHGFRASTAMDIFGMEARAGANLKH
eukprot:113243-Pyramimonas_sp.AAC.1